MRVVIALGGNALGNEPITQKENAVLAAKALVPIIKAGYEVVITHGNGPQVGLINLAFTEGHNVNEKVYQMPFAECGAMSEGYIGYHLQNALVNELRKAGINQSVCSIATQVEVDINDKAFENPTKPIGSFYSQEEAMDLSRKMGYTMKEDSGRGYRRVIASPKPIHIVEEKAIVDLLKAQDIVIACGGGGIPVIKKDDGYEGIDAVIDKDFASSKLASDIGADYLLILTAVPNAVINFRKENEELLFDISAKQIEEYNVLGHFGSGSMKPKVEASIAFAKSGGISIITTIENAYDALLGKAGTRIHL